MACHQLGSIGTRRVPDAFRSLPSSFAQWERRTQSGQAGAQMTAAIGMLGHQGPLTMFDGSEPAATLRKLRMVQ